MTILVHDSQGRRPIQLTKAQYDALCASGMMWEFHPDAPLQWPFPASPPKIALDIPPLIPLPYLSSQSTSTQNMAAKKTSVKSAKKTTKAKAPKPASVEAGSPAGNQ